MWIDVDRNRQYVAAGAICVRPLEKGDEAAWNAYAARHERATFFHQLGWKRVLVSTFRYRPHYLVARRGERICGILPLFACRSIKGRSHLISLPHTVYGGPLGDDREAEEALLEAARSLAGTLGARSIDLRNRYPSLLDLPVEPGCVTFEKVLPETVEQVRRTFPKKAREAINQATKRHKLSCDFAGGLDTFYDLLASSFLNLGTPVFPKRFFAAMVREFPDASIVQIVRHKGRPVASVLSMVWRDTIMPHYSGEAPGVKRLKANNFKYFRLMEEAVARGLKRFDFGRSRANNEGVMRFKANQGFSAEPLPYQTDHLGHDAEAAANPNSGVFQKLRRVWRRLPPRAARILGPGIVRYFP